MISKKQREIVETTAKKCVVISSAASGKTFCITERIKFLLRNDVDPKDIVAITFTNMAAAEMRRRIGNPQGLFIGTIHSLANYFLLSSGIGTRELLESENFDGLFEMIQQNPSCIKKVKYLIMDEMQDSNELQFKFVLDMIQPENFMLVGDYRQSLYRFNGARPDIFLSICTKPGVVNYYLDENYRNSIQILNFAKTFAEKMDYYDHSIPMYSKGGRVIRIDPYPSEILRYTSFDEPRDWFILCRTNAEVDEMVNLFTKANRAVDTFKQSQLTLDELNKKLDENTYKILTIHSAKGLEAKNCLVIGARPFNEEECSVCYVAATRAKDTLIWCSAKKRKLSDIKIQSWE